MVAAASEGRVAADHEKSATELLHQPRHVGELERAEGVASDVAVDHHVVVQQAGHVLGKALGGMFDWVDALTGLRIRVHRVEVLPIVAELPVKRGHLDARVALQRVFEVLPFGLGALVVLRGPLHVDHPQRGIDHFQPEGSLVVGGKPFARAARDAHLVHLESTQAWREFQFNTLCIAVEVQRLGREDLALLADLHGDGLSGEAGGTQVDRDPRGGFLRNGPTDLDAGDAHISHFVGGAAQEGVDAQPVAAEAASGCFRIQTLGFDAVGNQEHAGQGIFGWQGEQRIQSTRNPGGGTLGRPSDSIGLKGQDVAETQGQHIDRARFGRQDMAGYPSPGCGQSAPGDIGGGHAAGGIDEHGQASPPRMDGFFDPLRIHQAQHQPHNGCQAKQAAQGPNPGPCPTTGEAIAQCQEADDDDPGEDQPPRLRQLGELHHGGVAAIIEPG